MWLLATVSDSTYIEGHPSCCSLTTDFLPWMITFFLIKRDQITFSPHTTTPPLPRQHQPQWGSKYIMLQMQKPKLFSYLTLASTRELSQFNFSSISV